MCVCMCVCVCMRDAKHFSIQCAGTQQSPRSSRRADKNHKCKHTNEPVG